MLHWREGMTHSVPRALGLPTVALLVWTLLPAVHPAHASAQRLAPVHELSCDQSANTFRAAAVVIGAGAATTVAGVFMMALGSGGSDGHGGSGDSWSPQMSAGMTLTMAGFFSIGVGGLILMPLAIARRVRWTRQRRTTQAALVPNVHVARSAFRLGVDYTF